MTGISGSNSDPKAGSEPLAQTSGAASDPFARLHKMSTTAGLGMGDYVAINGAAVVALLLGAASATVLFNNMFFLVFPLAGVIAGIVSWMQISKSNGTQTGREVAAVGLLLSVAFGGFYAASSIYASYRNHSDEEQIVSQVHKLGSLLSTQDYVDAYAMFDARFQKHVSRSEFESNWRRVCSSPVLGEVRNIDWNKLLNFDIDPVDNTRTSSGMMLMKLKPEAPLRIHMSFRYEDGNWLVDQLPEVFPPEEAQQQGQKTASKPGQPLGPPKP
jgi:hypothetical protein